MISSAILTLQLLCCVGLISTFFATVALKGTPHRFRFFICFPLVLSSFLYAFGFLSLGDGLGLYELRSFLGLSLVLSLNLFPYIFISLLLGKSLWGESFEEVLSLVPRKNFIENIILRLRYYLPFWALGMGFLSFELMSEFGAPFLFGQETLAVYVFNLWLEQYDFTRALPGLALILMLVLVCSSLIFLFGGNDLSLKLDSKKKIKVPSLTYQLLTFCLFCCSVCLPVWQILRLSLSVDVWEKFEWSRLFFSVEIAILSLLLIAGGYFIGNNFSFILNKPYLKKIGLFYGIPGVVLGFGLFYLGFSAGVFVLTLGLSLKFFKFFVDHMDRAWKSLASGERHALTLIAQKKQRHYIEFLITRKFILVASALVVVEVFKELPLTLILKPVDKGTLATEIFTLVSEGDWELASPYALISMTLGFLVFSLTRMREEA